MMRKLKLVLFLVAWLAACSPVLHAQQSSVDTNRVGPSVGTTVPAFSGVDQFGRTQTLETAMGSKGLMLVFFRSADW
jgi:hypothetical protein